MPTAERYSRYRADQTTVWISKSARDFLGRERQSAGEGSAAVLDRILKEYKKMRGASGGAAKAPAAKKAGAKKAAKKGR